jgi:hypothetical protein
MAPQEMTMNESQYRGPILRNTKLLGSSLDTRRVRDYSEDWSCDRLQQDIGREINNRDNAITISNIQSLRYFSEGSQHEINRRTKSFPMPAIRAIPKFVRSISAKAYTSAIEQGTGESEISNGGWHHAKKNLDLTKEGYANPPFAWGTLWAANTRKI